MTMLPADPHVREAAAAIAASAPEGAILIDFSTVMPDTIRAVADAAPRLRVLSATCMKSVAAAKAGDLTVFVGGEDAALDEVRDLVAAMASVVAPVGRLEAAKTLKIVNNMMVASLNFVIAESAVLARSQGVTYRQLADALLDAGVGGWALQNHFVKHTLTDDLGPGYFSTAYMRKDISLAARLAERHGRTRFLVGLLLASYRGATALGHGDDFHPSTVRWIETEQAATPARDDEDWRREVLERLVAWAKTAERLIAVHGMALAVDSGMERARAAELLAAASADSKAVRDIANGSDTDWWANGEPTAAQVVEDTLGLADAAAATALGVEAGRDFVSLQLDVLRHVTTTSKET
jgi:3-hydroxyisobutyrate dehydrogenase-like beta-hydroxyacid dehydrogenase